MARSTRLQQLVYGLLRARCQTYGDEQVIRVLVSRYRWYHSDVATNDAISDLRMLAKIAIIVGCCVGSVLLVIGLLGGAASGFASIGCDSPGCAQQTSNYDVYFDLGLYGGGGVAAMGIVALTWLPRAARPR